MKFLPKNKPYLLSLVYHEHPDNLELDVPLLIESDPSSWWICRSLPWPRHVRADLADDRPLGLAQG